VDVHHDIRINCENAPQKGESKQEGEKVLNRPENTLKDSYKVEHVSGERVE